MLKRILFIVLSGFLVISCGNEKEVRYHENGKIEFEVPVIDGKWHGEAKGYYPDGSLKGKMTFINNKREGYCYEYFASGKVKEIMQFRNNVQVGTDELFNEEGQLIEKTFFDNRGHPTDFSRYTKDGTIDYSYFAPVTYLSDSARKDVPDTLWIRIGNADPARFDAGVLLVTSNFTNTGPQDTLWLQESTNAKGFYYPFTPEVTGPNRIMASLLFPSEKQIKIEYEFDVK